MGWRPGLTKKRLELEEPYEDVPEHLKVPLLDWLSDALGDMSKADLSALAISQRLQLSPKQFDSIHSTLVNACYQDDELHLDMIVGVLSFESSPTTQFNSGGNSIFTRSSMAMWERGRMLADLLERGNSAYKLNDAGNDLEMRITPGVSEAFSKTLEAASGAAATHLTASWNAVYGRKPDPQKGYSEAVKAAESALAKIVSPNDTKATLGKMITSVRDKPNKWILAGATPGVATILAMMTTLWDGQKSRHGGAAETKVETHEQAVLALHLAAALVQFSADGTFRVA